MNLKNKIVLLFTFLILIIGSSCNKKTSKANRIIVIQPFDDISTSEIELFSKRIKIINPSAIVKKSISLPNLAFYKPRNRYRADSLINYLKQFGNADTVVIGLTTKDISTTKGNDSDWGVMGLGFHPGDACIVSTFRLSKKNLTDQLYKVGIHELGHTQGLPHCTNKTCFMRDAEGENPLNEEKDFCSSCKSFLKTKGWMLN